MKSARAKRTTKETMFIELLVYLAGCHTILIPKYPKMHLFTRLFTFPLQHVSTLHLNANILYQSGEINDTVVTFFIGINTDKVPQQLSSLYNRTISGDTSRNKVSSTYSFIKSPRRQAGSLCHQSAPTHPM